MPAAESVGPRIRLVQLLCPQRHCIIAMAYFSQSGEAHPDMEDAMSVAFHRAVEAKVLNPHCGLCHSTDLHLEDGCTGWSTMEEAAPYLAQSAAAQAATAEYFRSGRN